MSTNKCIDPRIERLADGIVEAIFKKDLLIGNPRYHLAATGSAYITIDDIEDGSVINRIEIRIADHASDGCGWVLDLRADEDFESVWPKVLDIVLEEEKRVKPRLSSYL